MAKLEGLFANKKILIPYITAGDPNLKVTEKLIYKLEDAGADIIELGIPFSDPLADGPIIQASHFRSLKKKTALKDVFALVKRVRVETDVPLLFMLSVNLILGFGVKEFVAQAERVGLNGVVIPDLPPEEELSKDFKALDESDLDIIYLVAPNTPENRIKSIAARAKGFIYLVSITGVTGIRKSLSETVKDSIALIKKHTNLPICVGFGISNPKQAKQVAKISNGVIVGSAIVKLLEPSAPNCNDKPSLMERLFAAESKKKIAKVKAFVKSLRDALDAA